MKYRGRECVYLDYDEFLRYVKAKRIYLATDNMGVIKAASAGLSDAGSSLIFFYGGFAVAVASIVASFFFHWALFLISFISIPLGFSISRRIQSDSLLRACIKSREVYEIALENHWIYVTLPD